MTLTKLAGAVVLVAVLGGCGGPAAGPSSSGSVQVRPAPGASGGSTALPTVATLRTYFNGVATSTLASYDRALAVAVPGSPAAGYVTYLRAAAQAVADSGDKQTLSYTSAEVDAGAFRFCTRGSSNQACYRFSDITGASGKVVDFSVNGKPVSTRVAVGASTPVRVSGVDARATFVAGFESSVGDNLFVAVHLEAGAHDVSGVRATYGTVPGNQSRSARMSGPATVGTGSAASYVFAFPAARLGGTLTLSLKDGAGATGTVALPVH
jgi:hypothetical protein